MKCRVCREPAIIDIRRHNANFCTEHFLRLCRDQTAKAIKQFDMLAPGDRVLVAVSGGKDSLALWDLLLELGYETDDDYRLMVRIPMWSHYGSKASDTLTRAVQTNRDLRVLVTCGYYDTVTPMAVVRRAVEDAKLTPVQRKNIQYKNYEGGHMMYTNLPSLKKLSRDVRAFIRESAKRKRGPALVPTATRTLENPA